MCKVFGTVPDWLKCLPKLANANCNQEKIPELGMKEAETSIRREAWGKTRHKKSFKIKPRKYSISETDIIRSRWVGWVSDEMKQVVERYKKVKFLGACFYWVLPPSLSSGCTSECKVLLTRPISVVEGGGFYYCECRELYYGFCSLLDATASTTGQHYRFHSRKVAWRHLPIDITPWLETSVLALGLSGNKSALSFSNQWPGPYLVQICVTSVVWTLSNQKIRLKIRLGL